jgi:hypothetical protein
VKRVEDRVGPGDSASYSTSLEDDI